MTSTVELERLIQPSDLRDHEGFHSRAGRLSRRRRGWIGSLAGAIVRSESPDPSRAAKIDIHQ
jgi:hypothetical protein